MIKVKLNFENWPAKLPDVAASSVDTWNNLRASSTSASEANGASLILAWDSEMRMMASNCLQSPINIFVNT